MLPAKGRTRSIDPALVACLGLSKHRHEVDGHHLVLDFGR